MPRQYGSGTEVRPERAIAVRVWIQTVSGEDLQVDADALAWTKRAVYVRYVDKFGHLDRAWVWVGAVEGRWSAMAHGASSCRYGCRRARRPVRRDRGFGIGRWAARHGLLGSAFLVARVSSNRRQRADADRSTLRLSTMRLAVAASARFQHARRFTGSRRLGCSRTGAAPCQSFNDMIVLPDFAKVMAIAPRVRDELCQCFVLTQAKFVPRSCARRGWRERGAYEVGPA